VGIDFGEERRRIWHTQCSLSGETIYSVDSGSVHGQRSLHVPLGKGTAIRDNRQFDALTRHLSRTPSRRRSTQGLAVRLSRRGALGALTGSALGAALGLGALQETDAAPQPANAKCSSDTQCASGTCIRYGRCKKNGRLTGNCRCSCTDTALCPTGKSCRNGACFSDCTSPFTCPGTGGGGCGRGCACGATDLGTSCLGNNVLCRNNTCETSAECPTGSVCVDPEGTCVCGAARLCANPCGQGFRLPTTSSLATTASRSAGREDAEDILHSQPR
jgi:hypothetical protein